MQQLCNEKGYQRVICLLHWQDPGSLPLPPDWIQACNGHRSNPWSRTEYGPYWCCATA